MTYICQQRTVFHDAVGRQTNIDNEGGTATTEDIEPIYANINGKYIDVETGYLYSIPE